MRDQVRLLGWLNIGFAALNLALGLTLIAVMGAAGFAASRMEAPESAREAIPYYTRVTAVLGAALIVPSVPGLIAGWGLLRGRRWARTLTLVVAVLILVQFPAGTALGGFAFWVLRHPEVAAEFEAGPPG